MIRTNHFTRTILARLGPVVLLAGIIGLSGCAPKTIMQGADSASTSPVITAPSPDPRIGLGAGLFDAEEAIWNLRLVSATPPPESFVGFTNSDLAFKGNYAIQGNYNGVQIWDISIPSAPTLVTEYVCPASQSDVSVYGDLLFVSGEGLSGRLDCGTEGVPEAVSQDRLRGIRIFNIKDIRNPEYISNVQTCRGSHTHSVLKDPNDDENVYVYISGSADVRPADELSGCSGAFPDEDPASALFRIEVIKVPLAHPEQAAIVNSPRIFENLAAPPQHGLSEGDVLAIAEARRRGDFVVDIQGQPNVLRSSMVDPMLQEMAERRGATVPTAQDSTALRAALPAMIAARFGDGDHGPTQCHDITLYPEIGLAGGACEGYGLLLDIRDPANPKRMDAVADSNFAYWHSATFNNDGSKILFTDEWGGGGGPKCRATDPMEWGANAIFTLEDGSMTFKSYYKMPAPQTSQENCVAHNGSLIPIPGRDVMVQSWYQGGISVFDWTDASNPVEIAYHDRGPVDATQMASGGTWSVYWYNGAIVSSEIARGLDIFELVPSAAVSANEIEAANSVKLEYLNAQGQPKFVWPASFALAGAYADQLERTRGLSAARIATVRSGLAAAQKLTGSARSAALAKLSSDLAASAGGVNKVQMLAAAIGELSEMP